MPVGIEISIGDERLLAAGLLPSDERLVHILDNFASGQYMALSRDIARAAAVRIRASKHDHDQQLEIDYAKNDAFRSALWHQVLQALRAFSQLRIGSTHCDFNSMRYDKMDKVAAAIADELEQALRKTDWFKS